MRVLQATDDLVVEVWPSDTSGDHPLVKLRSLSMEQDSDADAAGVVVVYPEELDALVAALTEAALLLEEEG